MKVTELTQQRSADQDRHAAEIQRLRDLRFQKFQAMTIAHSQLPDIEHQLQQAKIRIAAQERGLEDMRQAAAEGSKSQQKLDIALLQRTAAEGQLEAKILELSSAQDPNPNPNPNHNPNPNPNPTPYTLQPTTYNLQPTTYNPQPTT